MHFNGPDLPSATFCNKLIEEEALALVCGRVALVCGRVALVCGRVALVCGRVALVCGRVALVCGRVALVCGRVALVCGRVALVCGRVALVCGRVAVQQLQPMNSHNCSDYLRSKLWSAQFNTWISPQRLQCFYKYTGLISTVFKLLHQSLEDVTPAASFADTSLGQRQHGVFQSTRNWQI